MSPHAITDSLANGDDFHSAEDLIPKAFNTQPKPNSSSNGSSLLSASAIVGMSFAFPQDATSIDAFWSMLMQARCASEEFPESRLNKSAFYHSDSTRQDSLPFRGGHFLNRSIAAFDAPFFSISASEAMGMDPLQRGLLETTYRALENAGIPLDAVVGSKTSVYTGCFTTDWRDLYAKDPDQWPSYAATGVSTLSMCANRISWFFDLRGTSANVDTACSSSLVALDMACRDLQTGEATMAIVGAGNLIYSPDFLHILQSMNMLSIDSKCHSFDDRANGYARGEGFAVIVLKNVTEAIKARDTIRAVIRATGTNQDGRTQLITQPSGDAHETLIRETYNKAGLHPSSASYIEAHGTGTPVGDPIEANAIGRVFKERRRIGNPLIVGTVKSNIGHLEGASGLAGLIKTVLVLERGIIPPNANFVRQNVAIDAEYLNLNFPTIPIVWPNDGPRIASVNSFGYGGSNAHVILEDAYHYLREQNLKGNHITIKNLPSQVPESTHQQLYSPVAATSPQDMAPPTYKSDCEATQKQLLVFSAADEEGINRIVEAYSRHFRKLDIGILSSNSFWSSLSYTLDSRRSSLPWKCFGVFGSSGNLHDIEQTVSHPICTIVNFKPTFTFVFTGQGAQWPRMGVELMERYSIFGHYLEMCALALKDIGCPWDLIEELHKSKASSKINFPEYSQPICTASQIAYIELLRNLNIVPETVLGHSSGEIAAAYSIGALSLQYAMKVAYYRGLLATDLENESMYTAGAMMAVGLSKSDIQPYFDAISKQYGNCALVVACINSQTSITVSGNAEQLSSLESILGAANIFARKLKVNVAYHSPLMTPIATKYLEAIGDMKEMMAAISRKILPTMISSVTGEVVGIEDLRLGSYWVKNMLAPVNFLRAMNRLCQVQQKPPHKLDGSHRNVFRTNTLIEVGPHSALQGPIREIIGTARADWIEYYPVLKRNQSAIDTILDTAGRLHCRGFSELNFALLNRPDSADLPPYLTDLPEYEFNHSRDYWWETRISKQYRLSGAGRLDLLGKQAPDWIPQAPRWRNFIKVSEMPWTEHHKINGSILYPAAGMLVMAIEAAHQIAIIEEKDRSITGFSLKNTHFSLPLIVPASSDGVEIQFHLRTKGPSTKLSTSEWSEFVLYAWGNDQCLEICRGYVRVEFESENFEIGTPDIHSANNLELDDHHNLCEKSSSASTWRVDQQDFYQALNGRGYEFGPAFQSLSNISSSENGSTADVKVFEGLHNEHLQPHIVHPTTLDGIFHLGLAGSCRKGLSSGSLAVPTFIEKLWVSKKGLNFEESSMIKAVSVKENNFEMASDSGTFTKYSASALDNSETRVLVKIDGLRMSTVDDTSEVDTEAAEKSMCHSLSWFPDSSLLGNAEIMDLCNSLQNRPENDLSLELSTTNDMETAALLFIARTLENPIHSYPQPYLKKYALWAERHLRRLHMDSTKHAVVKSLLEDDVAWEHFIRRVEAASGRGRLISKVGRSLHGVISGEIDPLGLLFENSDDLVRQTYKFTDETSATWRRFLVYLKLVTQQNPNMSILEIGAGTGATTEILMKQLIPDQKNPRFFRYDYTDISAEFFDEAKSRFGSHHQVSFKLLNVELDPGSQGFQYGSYDVIVASNVLHATTDVKGTLKNVHRLLKPGGKLVLCEATNIEVLRTSFAFGILPGWWLGEESFRTWGATMTREVWQEVLVDTEFSGIDMLFSDYEDDSHREIDVMVSTALKSSHEHVKLDCDTLQNGRPLSNGNSLVFRNGLATPPNIKKQIFHLIIDATSQSQSLMAHQIQYDFNSRQNMHKETHLIFQISNLSRTSQLDNIDSIICIFLLETDQPFLHNIDEEQFTALQHVICSSRGNLWINCAADSPRGTPSYALADGLSRVTRSELTAIFIIVSFHITSSMLSVYQVDSLFAILSKIDFDSSDVNYEPMYLEIDGIMNIERMMEDNSLAQNMATASPKEETMIRRLDEVPALELLELEGKSIEPGVFEVPMFTDDQRYDQDLEADEVEIKVHALGLAHNIFVSKSSRPSDNKVSGFCWSGVVTRLGSNATLQYCVGDTVIILTKSPCKTYVRGKVSCTSKIPPNMSFTAAAALPISFVAAWQCINGIARLEKGESILIHEATGSLLDAAVQISQYLGANIFITILPNIQKSTLADQYGIPESHIIHSDGDEKCLAAVKRLTNHGVDVVFNLSSGENLLGSWDLVKSYGRFVDLGNSTLLINSDLSSHPFKRGASISSFNFEDWMISKPGQIKSCLENFVKLYTDSNGTWSGTGTIQTFPISKLKQAHALMDQNQNVNEIALEFNPTDKVATLSKRAPTYSFHEEATYIIAGGLGSIGRATARWMVNRGAKNLILLSRSGPKTSSAQEFLSELHALGITVAAPACNITSLSTLRNTLEHLRCKMPPIKGCIQASMVLSDSAFQSMTYAQWKSSTSPKVQGSWNLHTLLPTDLDFFILLSSLSGIIGLPGQSNYAAGNTYLDSLARYRVMHGQKAVSIALGVMDEDGVLSENSSMKQKVLDAGPLTPISRDFYFNLLEFFCNPEVHLDEKSCNPIIGLQGRPATNLPRTGGAWTSWLQSPVFSLLQNSVSQTSSSDASSSNSQSLQVSFVEAKTPQEAVSVVLEALVRKIATMNGGIKEELIDPKSAMHNYGVDSLVAIEVRKWAKREFAAEVAVFDILGGGTFLGVAGLIVERSKIED